MLVFTPNGEKIEPPTVGIAWKDENGQISKKEIQLPITINKFLNAVELTHEKFSAFYKEYSLPSEKFYKLDAFMKTPEGVKLHDFQKKLGSFLSSVCSFKCNANPSFNEIKTIYGSAVLPTKEG